MKPIITLTAALGLAFAGWAHAEEPILIKFSHVAAVDTPKGRAAEYFKQQVEKRTKGRVKIEVFPNSTLYKDKEELEALYAVCRHYGLYLFIDGARLGYGLTAPDNDLTLADITNNCDVFCIGGTKCGALFGEAAVIINPALKDDFRTIMKQGGAVLAKGRLLGLQFETLFTDGLYYKICRHGVELALQIKVAVQERGLGFVTDSTTNQQFIIVENSRLPELQSKVVYSFIEKYDAEHTVIRLATSWATTEEQVDELLSIL